MLNIQRPKGGTVFVGREANQFYITAKSLNGGMMPP